MSNLTSMEKPQFENISINFVKYPLFMFAGHINNEKKYYFPRHMHANYSEVIYIASGKGEFYIGDKRYTALEGDVIIFNAGLYHEEKYDSDLRVETYFCGISNTCIEGFSNCWITPVGVEPVIHLGKYKMQIENMYEQLFKESRLKKVGFTSAYNSLSILLIVNLLRIINEQQLILKPSNRNVSDQLVRKIKDYLDYNFHQKIILDDLAQQFHISVYYLSHLFKKVTGYSVINYLISRRIDESKVFLGTTQLTINEISNMVGYESSNNFYTVFKKSTGLTPENYRKQFNNQFTVIDCEQNRLTLNTAEN